LPWSIFNSQEAIELTKGVVLVIKLNAVGES